MTAARHIVRQRDFSGGEVVEHAKRRDDEAIVRSASRALRNVRILSTGAAEQRPGRSALFQETGRVVKVRMTTSYFVYFCFGDGVLTIRNSAGAPVARGWSYAWTATTSATVVMDRSVNDIVMTFTGQVPKIARWDGSTGWSLLDWAAAVTSGGQKRVPFYRLAPLDITLLPSARTGSINITFSENFLLAGHVGARLRFVNRQLTVATVTNGTTGTATVNEPLPGSQVLTFASDPRNIFATGEIVEGVTSGSKGYISALGATTMTVQLVTTNTTSATVGFVPVEAQGTPVTGSSGFVNSEVVIGPGGGLAITGSGAGTIGNPVACPIWDEEIMNNLRGYPLSVTHDQSRLIFCDFPALPEAVVWSALASSDDFYPGPAATDAIFETAPKHSRVYHVMEGADEFVMTDTGIYYIPVSEANPLRPGSVAFRRIPGPNGSAVRPAITSHGLVYANAGLNRILAVVGTGQTAMPWMVRPVSDLHSHLFSEVTCLAFDDGDGETPEEMVYAVNSDGTVVAGRYQPGKEWVGWVPWEGDGNVKWISVAGGDVVFSTSYDSGWITEVADADQYLDAAVAYNAIPSALSTGAQAEVMMSHNQGTVGGDMTANGGLAAARDGTTSQNHAASAAKGVASTGYIFVRFGQKMKISKAIVYPSSNAGFGDSATHSLQLRGFNGGLNPSGPSDGTLIGSTGAFANTVLSKTMTSSDTTTEWDAVIVSYFPSSGGLSLYCAEIQIFTPGLTHGSGELWFMPSARVDIMDGRRVVGSGTTDANGELTAVPSPTDENVGFGFDVTIEPFMPHVGPGDDKGQTMHRRQVSSVAVAVQNSTGFKVQSYNRLTAAWQDEFTREAYDATDDETAEPPAREEVVIAKPRGNEFDPRIRIVKDYPGPLRVLEISDEVDA